MSVSIIGGLWSAGERLRRDASDIHRIIRCFRKDSRFCRIGNVLREGSFGRSDFCRRLRTGVLRLSVHGAGAKAYETVGK